MEPGNNCKGTLIPRPTCTYVSLLLHKHLKGDIITIGKHFEWVINLDGNIWGPSTFMDRLGNGAISLEKYSVYVSLFSSYMSVRLRLFCIISLFSLHDRHLIGVLVPPH